MSFIQDSNFENSPNLSDSDESISVFMTRDICEEKVNIGAKVPANENLNKGIFFEGIHFENIDTSHNTEPYEIGFENSGNFESIADDLNFDFPQEVHGNTDVPAVGFRENTEVNLSHHHFTENLKKKNKPKNNPLLLFTDNPNSNMKKGKGGEKKLIRQSPKKEYYRTKLIRSWKKAIRLLKKPNPSLSLAESSFHNHLKENYSILSEISETTRGPLTEAQTKRKDKKTDTDAKTFNNSHVLNLFANQIYRESFVLYVNSLFEGKDPKNLCEKFLFNCCTNNSHNKECESLWKRLKIYSYSDLIGIN